MLSLVLGLFLQIGQAQELSLGQGEEIPPKRIIQRYSKEEAIEKMSIFPIIFKDLSPEVSTDMNVIYEAIRVYPPNAAFIAPELLEDRKFVESLLEVNVVVLRDLPKEFQHDKNFLRRAIQIDPLAVLVMPKEYKDDDILMKLAVRRKPLAYNFISDRLKQDKYIVSLALADSDPNIWRAIPKNIQQDEAFLRPLVLKNCGLLQHTHSHDIEVVLDCASRDPDVFKFAVPVIKNNKALLKELLRIKPALLAASELNKDKDFVLSLLPEYKLSPQYLGVNLLNDIDIAEKFIEIDPVFFQEFPEDIRSNTAIANQAVTKSMFNFEFIGDKLKADYEFVAPIIEENGSYLRYISDDLKKNKELIELAVSKDYKAFDYADSSLQEDLAWIASLLVKYPQQVQRFKDVMEDKRWGVGKLPTLFRYEKSLVELGLKTHGESLEFAPEHFRADKKLVLLAIEQNGLALEFASDALRNDVKLVQKAVKQNSGAIRFAGPAVLENKKLLRKWSKKNDRLKEELRKMGD